MSANEELDIQEMELNYKHNEVMRIHNRKTNELESQYQEKCEIYENNIYKIIQQKLAIEIDAYKNSMKTLNG